MNLELEIRRQPHLGEKLNQEIKWLQGETEVPACVGQRVIAEERKAVLLSSLELLASQATKSH